MTANLPQNPPPGLVGDFAQFIYGQAPYPIPEVALGAAIGLMAGICGRAWQTPNPMAGLNLYVLVVAPTGKGKEAGADGIDRIMTALVDGPNDNGIPQMPAAANFIGPSHFASEAGITRHLAGVSKSCVSIIGEAGKSLQRMANPKGSQHDKDVGTCLLKLYGKSKHGSIYRGTAYADKRNNVPDIPSPAISIYAEGTPETVFANLTEGTITDGLFPRFLILESTGEWSDLNRHGIHEPSPEVIARASALCAHALELDQRNEVLQVQISDDADDLFEAFRKTVRAALAEATDEVSRHLWSRSHLRALKLASLIAVGVDHMLPTITRDIAVWAIGLEQKSTNGVSARFDSGEVGDNPSDEAKQERELVRTVHRYITTEFHKLPKLRTCAAMHGDKVVPLSYLQQSLMQKSAFKGDRIGATAALKRTVQNFLDAGDLVEVNKMQLSERYSKTGRAFVISKPERFIDAQPS